MNDPFARTSTQTVACIHLRAPKASVCITQAFGARKWIQSTGARKWMETQNLKYQFGQLFFFGGGVRHLCAQNMGTTKCQSVSNLQIQ